MDKRVCLITGSSAGIGVGIALCMVKKAGCKRLALVARRKEKLEEVAKELKKAGAKDVLILAKDLSDHRACAQAVKETVSHFGRLDILINNAGILRNANVADMSPDVFKELLNVNVVSPQVMSKEAIPHLRKAKGNIIFISSIAGQSVMPTAGGYCASKAAVTQLAKAIALEEAPHGVRANVVSPGVILTDLVRKFFQEQSGQKMSDEQLKEMQAMALQPLKRAGMPSDIGEAVAFLANNDVSGFVTGSDLVVDGGSIVAGGAASIDQNAASKS